jgi:mannosyltransferase OCH1-like enzyme
MRQVRLHFVALLVVTAVLLIYMRKQVRAIGDDLTTASVPVKLQASSPSESRKVESAPLSQAISVNDARSSRSSRAHALNQATAEVVTLGANLPPLVTSSEDRAPSTIAQTSHVVIPPPVRESMEDWFTWWTGERLTKDKLPIKATATIPDRLFMTWKSKELPTSPPTARQYWDNWRHNEPQLDRVILSDAECAVLASFYPDLKSRYDALPLNVMRADICRVLAIYYFGGYYKDLDVDWRKPLKEWVRPTDDVVYGWEDDEHLCQWFFAAKPGDKCVHSILQHITNIIANTSYIDFKTNIEAVIDITGPGVWTDAMQGCPWQPKYTYDELKFHNVYHDYASQRWEGDDYKSWTKDRKEKAGWDEVWPAYPIEPYFMSRADVHLMPPNNKYPVIKIVKVRQSSTRHDLPNLTGAQNAFDGLLDTYVETNNEEWPWFEFSFETALNIATVLHPNETHLTGVRVYNRHREPGARDFAEGLHMELFDEDGRMFYRLSKQKRMATFYLYNLAGMPNKLKKIRFSKKPDRALDVPQPHRPRLTFAEIQLYSDHLCLSARRVETTLGATVPDVLRLATTIQYRCPNGLALSPFMGFQYAYCGSPPPHCTALSITAKLQTEIDSSFVSKMRELGCPMITVGPTPVGLSRNIPNLPTIERHFTTTWCESGGKCNYLAELTKATGGDKASFLYLDAICEDWMSETSILSVLDHFTADILLLPFRINSASVEHPATLEHFKRITQRYNLYAVHVNPGEGEIDVNGHAIPKEFHLSFKPR